MGRDEEEEPPPIETHEESMRLYGDKEQPVVVAPSTERSKADDDKPIDTESMRIGNIANRVTQRLQAVNEVTQAQAVIDTYINAFKRRNHIEPIIDGSGRETLKSLCRTLGVEKAKRLVAHYLTMNDEYYVKFAHDLNSLKKFPGPVLASLGRKTNAEKDDSGIKIMDEVDRFLFYVFNTSTMYKQFGLDKKRENLILPDGRELSPEDVNRSLSHWRGHGLTLTEVREIFKTIIDEMLAPH